VPEAGIFHGHRERQPFRARSKSDAGIRQKGGLAREVLIKIYWKSCRSHTIFTLAGEHSVGGSVGIPGILDSAGQDKKTALSQRTSRQHQVCSSFEYPRYNFPSNALSIYNTFKLQSLRFRQDIKPLKVSFSNGILVSAAFVVQREALT
jgi:hypothetical protein